MLCDISGSMEPYARAYLQFLTCAAGSGPDAEVFSFATRHPAHAGAGLARPGARHPARGRRGAGLVERHPHRRRAQGVQRPARPPRHGPGRGGGDPLRRLGARRSGTRRPRVSLLGLAHRIVWVNPRAAASGFSARRRDGRRAAPLRRAGQRPQLRRPRRGGRRHRRDHRGGPRARPGEATAPRSRAVEEEPWASATPVPGSSVSMPSGYGPSQGNGRRRGGPPVGAGRRRREATASIRAATDRRRGAPAGRAAPAFCDLEEHNALTAHQERQRIASSATPGDEEG